MLNSELYFKKTIKTCFQFEPTNSEQQLIEDYQRLFSQELLCDFAINVNGKIIRAHKAVLAARSPVFNAMLTHQDTDEAKSVCFSLLKFINLIYI